MFRLKMLNSIHHAELYMQHNGGDPRVFVSQAMKTLAFPRSQESSV